MKATRLNTLTGLTPSQEQAAQALKRADRNAQTLMDLIQTGLKCRLLGRSDTPNWGDVGTAQRTNKLLAQLAAELDPNEPDPDKALGKLDDLMR